MIQMLVFGSVVALGVGGVALPAEGAGRPNLVYLLLDDAGVGDLSCYGQARFRTPQIDRLGAEGMRFTRHYSGSTVCAPTRSVLMTGRHTGHTAVRGNKEVQPVGQHPLPADTVTLPERLKEAGYATGAFGKWGLGFPGSEGDPVRQGFDRFFGYNCQRNAHTYYPTWLFDDDEKVELDGRTWSHDVIMGKALAWIRERAEAGEGPFFCFLPVTIPHAAMHVPAEWSDPFRKAFPQFEDAVGKYAGTEVTNPVAAFAGMMTKLDADVGRLLDLLEELGIDDDTVVMLSSDNGPHREGGHRPDFFDSSGGLRGVKRDLYEGGIRAPFLARWPGRIPAGTTSDLVSAHWDVVPTLCELAGAPVPPAETDGISLVATLLGRPEEQARHDHLYWEFYEGNGKRAALFDSGRWKAVQLGLHQNADPPIELYDLEADPTEAANVAADHPELVAQARSIFRDEHTPSPVWSWRGEREGRP